MRTSRFFVRALGTEGFLSRTFRATRPGDPKGSILKVGPLDPIAREFSRKIKSFRRETLAYKLLRPFTGKIVPKCFNSFSSQDGSDGFLWLEEISPARSGDQISGLSPKELAATARSMGRIHARFWKAPKQAGTDRLPVHRYNLAHETRTHLTKFRKLDRSFLPSRDRLVLRRLPAVIAHALQQVPHRPATLLHGDLRADNLLFSRGRVFIVDWQIAAWGLGTFDLARVIGGSTRHPLRLAEQKKLVTVWHQTLQRGGVRGYSLADAWRDYRIGVALTLSIPITNGPTLARLSPRGKRITRLMIRRFFHNGRQFGLL